MSTIERLRALLAANATPDLEHPDPDSIWIDLADGAIAALPALLDVAEAGKRFVEFSPVEQAPDDAMWIAKTFHGALRAALARLDGAS